MLNSLPLSLLLRILSANFRQPEFNMKPKLIKKVLMCKPLYFDALDYVINPWMTPGTINEEKAMLQWQKLVDTYKNLDITVEIIDQERGNPDMVFATDQGIVQGKKVLLSRFWCDERKQE